MVGEVDPEVEASGLWLARAEAAAGYSASWRRRVLAVRFRNDAALYQTRLCAS